MADAGLVVIVEAQRHDTRHERENTRWKRVTRAVWSIKEIFVQLRRNIANASVRIDEGFRLSLGPPPQVPPIIATIRFVPRREGGMSVRSIFVRMLADFGRADALKVVHQEHVLLHYLLGASELVKPIRLVVGARPGRDFWLFRLWYQFLAFKLVFIFFVYIALKYLGADDWFRAIQADESLPPLNSGLNEH